MFPFFLNGYFNFEQVNKLLINMSQSKYNPGRDQSSAVAVIERRVQAIRLKFSDDSESKIKPSPRKRIFYVHKDYLNY